MGSEERKMEIVCLVKTTNARRENTGSLNKYDCLFYPSKSFYEASFESQCLYSFGA